MTRAIRVKGKIGGLEKIWEVDPVAAEDQGLPVRLLWARDRIRDLEESDAGVDARGSRQKERKRDKVKETIIDLSKEYGLLSRLTSFVAIEERQEKEKAGGGIELDVAVSKALSLDLGEIKKTAALIKGSLRVSRFLFLSTAILLSVRRDDPACA